MSILGLQTGPNINYQFGRALSLVVANSNLEGLELSQLRVKFSIKRSGVMSPNVADIRVYNLDLNTATSITKEFNQVVLQAGYESNVGVIFKGNIRQFIIGRENATDTFLDIIAADGSLAYNYSVTNTTLAAGSSQQDQLNAHLTAMQGQGVGTGYVGLLPQTKLPRGKVLYGTTRDMVRSLATNAGFAVSIQDENVYFLSQKTYLPGTAVVLNSKTGMIGTPQQTVQGVICKCLLNPGLKIHGRIQINNAAVQAYKLDQFQPGSAANTPVPLNNDGFYYIWGVDHTGDSRGTEWYSNLVLMSIDATANVLDSVPAGFGP